MKKTKNFFGTLFMLLFVLCFTAQAVTIQKATHTTQPSNAIDIVSSDVFSINQKKTKEKKSWTYTIQEAGNYQIGNAWIWVEGKNKTVDFEIKIGGEIVKKFTAKSTKAPYRFESRLEGLSKGTVLNITATPNRRASYKVNCRLAYGTPSFEGLPTFHVATYGAIGDGTHNDYQAIKDACNAVIAAGGGILTFDGTKKYYIRGPQGYLLFDFKEKSNLKIEGNGATVLLHPDGSFMYLDRSENIHIDGFKTTYVPLPYFQGDILDINVSKVYLDMQVDARYEAPLTGKYISSQERFGRSFWRTVEGTNMGEGRHLGVDSTAQIGNDKHKIRVFFKKKEKKDLQASKTKKATTFIAPHRDYAHVVKYRESYYATIVRSSRVKISNILTNSVCHFAYKVGNNNGPITFTNTDILVPNKKDMHVTWRDGWHVWGNRYGIMIEDGDFDAGYMYDDVFSPHVCLPILKEINKNTITIKTKSGEHYEKYTDKRYWLVGDLVSFWNKNQTVYQGMGRITAVKKGKTLSYLSITLDDLSKEVTEGSFALNEELINRDMVIRNCTTTPSGRVTAVRQRTPILYENCDFKNIHFWIYNGEPYRIRPRNIVFRNNSFFERRTFNVDDAWNVSIKNSSISGQIDLDNCPNVWLDNANTKEIKLKNNSLVHVFGGGNTKTPPKKDSTSTIKNTAPAEYDRYAPPFLMQQ